MRVEVSTDGEFRASVPQVLIDLSAAVEGRIVSEFDVSPDGAGFFMLHEVTQDPPPPQLVFVPDFAQELRERVPVD